MLLQGDPALGLGWSFSLGKIVEAATGIPAAYIAPDGSAHRLYNKRFFGGTTDGFFYTRDGSYLRVKYVNSTSGYQVWSQNGNLTTFGHQVTGFDNLPTNYQSDYGRGRNGWHATSIANPYGDTVVVSYQASYAWVPYQITVPSIGGSSRTITVNMNGSVIGSFDVPTFNGANAVYTLTHSNHGSLQRPVAHPSPNPSPNLLDRIDLPNAGYASSYGFTYVDGLNSIAYSRGALDTQKVPTGATINYDYGTWTFYHANVLNRPGSTLCQFPPPPFSGRPIILTGPGVEPLLPPISDCKAPDRVAGVVQRTVSYTTLTGTDTAVTKYHQYDFPNGESNSQTGSQTETLIVSPTDEAGRQHSTTYLFPASTATSTTGDATGPFVSALIRAATFSGDASSGYTGQGGVCFYGALFCTTNALRVQKMTYSSDAFSTDPNSIESTEANRRLLQSVTVYNSMPADQSVTGRFHQIDYTYDSNAGRYVKESHSGNIGGDGRETETTWTTLNDSTHWKLDMPQTVVLRSTPGGAAFSTVASSFDSNGFIASSTMTDNAGGYGTLQSSTPRDAHGFAQSETVSHAGTSYTRNLTFLAGTLKTAQWSGFTWYAVNNNDIDSSTGFVRMSTDSTGLSTSFTYDLFGRPRVSTPPGGDAVTTVTYVSPTQTTSQTADNGAVEYGWSQTFADSLGRAIKAQRKMNGGAIVKKVTRYDRQGNGVFESEWIPDGNSDSIAPGTRFSSFDDFGQPRTIALADGKISTIDYSDTFSNPNSIWLKAVTINDVGGSSSTTRYWSDAFGNLMTVTEPGPVSADTTYTYSPQNRLVGVTQGGQTRAYTWDSFGFLRQERFPEVLNQSWSYSYDALGNVTSETQPPGSGSSTINRDYDSAGRLMQVRVGAVTHVVNCYDGNGPCPGNVNFTGGSYPTGNLTTRVGYNPGATPAANIKQDFNYSDRAGRLSARTTTFSTGAIPPQAEAWIYDLAGQIVDYSHPRSAGLFVVQTTRDHGYPTALRANGLPVVVSTTYQPSGMLGSYVTGNNTGHNVTTTIAIDATTYMSRPMQISTSGASTTFATGLYAYDGAGNIRQMGADTFGYDALSRLTSATLSGLGTQGFNYDRWANLAGTTGVNPRSYSVNTSYNHLTNATYDSRGNLLTIGTETHTWDALNRTVRYQALSGVDWKYLYDGGGERLLKIPASGATSDYTWTFRDEGGRVATEYVGGVLSRDNVYLGSLLVGSFASCAQNGPPGWSYYSSDHLGTPRLITDATGTTVDSRKYWPYGDEAAVTQPLSSQRLRFAGMERDTEANRFYDHARSYDFQLVGRFLGVDLLGGDPTDPQSLNRYAYVVGNPLILVDPSGLDVDVAPLVYMAEGAAAVPTGHFENGQLFLGNDSFPTPTGASCCANHAGSGPSRSALSAIWGTLDKFAFDFASPWLNFIVGAGRNDLGQVGLGLAGIAVTVAPIKIPGLGRLATGAARFLPEDILVLGRGPVARLQALAAKHGGRISTIESHDARVIWKNIYRDLRSADRIIQYMDNVPTTLGDVFRMGMKGQYSRAEFGVIKARPDLLSKTTRLFEHPPM